MPLLLEDLRFGLRQIRKNLGVSLAAIFILALGIAANTVTFTLVKATLLEALPYPEPERLVQLWETRKQGSFERMEFSHPDFMDYAARNRSFSALGSYSGSPVAFRGPEGAEQAPAIIVSSSFFDVLGVQPALGRGFVPGDDAAGAPKKVVLSYAGWQRRFSGDPRIIGRSIVIDDLPHTVVGVLPRDFQFAPSGASEFWLPLEVQGWRLRRNAYWEKPVGRLKPGVTMAEAQSEVSTLADNLAREYPESNATIGASVASLRDEIVGPVRPVLLLLMTAVAFLLLIMCGNLAGLLLTQGIGRQKELSIRLALGARRGQIARMLLTESCLLSFCGGAAGVALSFWLLPLALRGIPKDALRFMPAWQNLHVDGLFLVFALSLAMFTGILFGMVPVLNAFRPSLRESLHEGTRSSGGAGRNRLRNVLVVSEIALAIVLLHGAGVMLKSLRMVLRVDPGFRAANLLTLGVDLPGERYAKEETVRAYHERMTAKVAALPGVTGVATTSTLPLTGGNNTSLFVREGRRNPAHQGEIEANSREVSPAYFAVMGIPLKTGRFFTEHDGALRPHVAVINQTLADRMFAGENPIGQRIDFTYTSDPNLWEIVGIVGDENATALDAKPNPVIYTPFDQGAGPGWSVVVRTAQTPESVSATVEQAVRSLDLDVAVHDVRSMNRLIEESPSIFVRRTPAYLIASFAGVGLLLASVGLYGLLAYSVAQRGREFGIRLAIGAQKSDLISLVVGGGLKIIATGAAIGIAAALAVTRLMGSLLFLVTPGDPYTIAGVVATLLLVCLLAVYLPARRAAATDPIDSLRAE